MNHMLMEIKALTWRAFLHSKRTPVVVIAGLIQPIIWLVLFSNIFKNSPMAQLSGADSYMAFITPGALVFTAFTAALNGGVPILFDRELGFLDRLLAAPLRSRMSIIWATGLHIFVMTLLQCVIIILLTLILGVRLGGGVQGALVVVAVLGLISLMFTTLSLTLAFVLRKHFELISIVMIISLPMAFISTAFAPVEYMPSWLSWFVSVNPITLTVEPLRAVFFNADWSWSADIYSAPYGALSINGCISALVIMNVLMGLLARKAIRAKLR